MPLVVFIAGVLAITAVTLVWELRSNRAKAESELWDFAMTVPAPLTDDVRRWLRPQLARRTNYPAIGLTIGIMAANIPLTAGWDEVPWYWFTVAIAMSVGLTVGTLVAGYRTTPLVDGTVRTVDPARRRVPDHFDHAEVLRLRVALVVSVAALGLAGAIVTSSDTATGSRTLVACALGAVLVAAHYAVAATVISRPMVASTPEGLLWHRALVSRALKPLPSSALLDGLLSAAIVLTALVVTYRDLPLSVLLLGATFAIVSVAITAFVYREYRREHRRQSRPLVQPAAGRTAP